MRIRIALELRFDRDRPEKPEHRETDAYSTAELAGYHIPAAMQPIGFQPDDD